MFVSTECSSPLLSEEKGAGCLLGCGCPSCVNCHTTPSVPILGAAVLIEAFQYWKGVKLGRDMPVSVVLGQWVRVFSWKRVDLDQKQGINLLLCGCCAGTAAQRALGAPVLEVLETRSPWGYKMPLGNYYSTWKSWGALKQGMWIRIGQRASGGWWCTTECFRTIEINPVNSSIALILTFPHKSWGRVISLQRRTTSWRVEFLNMHSFLTFQTVIAKTCMSCFSIGPLFSWGTLHLPSPFHAP